jgi:hypothetical protein
MLKYVLIVVALSGGCIDGDNDHNPCVALTIPPPRPVIVPVSLGQDHTVTISSLDYQAAQTYMFTMASWAKTVIAHEHCLGD